MSPAPADESGGSPSPPPPPVRGAEGADVLAEIPRGEGMLLAWALRDVALWLRTPRERRVLVFPDGGPELRARLVEEAGVEEPLRAPLLALAEITALDTRRVETAGVGAACLAVARYAEERGLPATRLAFTEAAARAMPENAKLALEAGKLARDSAEYARAEKWFRRAVRAARRVKDRETYLWSYIGLAVLYMRLGNYPASHAVTNRALRAAQHHRMRGMEGLAYHQLFILKAESSRFPEAYEHADRALRAYSGKPPRVIALAHDVARLWINQESFLRALQVFDAVLLQVSSLDDRAIVLANIARAAAGARNRTRYEEARQGAVRLVGSVTSERCIAELFAILAAADLQSGETQLAKQTAEVALAMAIRRREVEVRVMAESILRETDRADRLIPSNEEMPLLARRADRLAAEIVRHLHSEHSGTR